MDLLNRKFLLRNFCFLYRLMVSSAPLLEFAISKLPSGDLRDYYAKHLEEERGHEDLLLSDIKSLGSDVVPHDFTAAQIAGSQYYLIAHFHPALLLGYMELLEQSTIGLDLIEKMEATHGARMTAARLHAAHDPDHIADLLKIKASLPKKLIEAINWNKECCFTLLKGEAERWSDA